MKISYCLYILVFVVSACQDYPVDNLNESQGIQISKANPGYWQFNGRNTLLLGGSDEDNLFQSEDLTEQLDALQACGGNYVRNTMSSRDSGNAWPFYMNKEGRYDLAKWDERYWERFERFLRMTAERDIIVQIELWATFDFYRDNWKVNPYNPDNNINYDSRRSKLPLHVPTHPVYTENNFFRSVPSQMALSPVLWYQKQYIEKLLFYALQYDHILYCMDNETSVTADWGEFWSLYIKKQADLKGKRIHTTEMWDPHDLSHPFHNQTFDHPEIYSFVDISQNNHKGGDEHWDNGLRQIERLKKYGVYRPVNNVKIYGNDGGRHQTTRNAIESFIRNMFFGAASARFHRPTSGQGINETAQAVIKSIRMLSDTMDFFNAAPRNDLLTERSANEAYCRAIPVKEYAVYFTDGGKVKLNIGASRELKSIVWINVLRATWNEDKIPSGVSGVYDIECPGKGHWIAYLR